MSLQFVALSFADGSVGIMQFALAPRLPAGALPPGYDPGTGLREATDEAIAHEIARSGLQPTGWRRISPEDLPATRAYRGAWTDTGVRIEHDMVKARDIHREKLRRARAPLLAALDVEYQLADEQNDTKGKRAVAARKQALRDAPADPRIAQAETIEQLASIALGDG